MVKLLLSNEKTEINKRTKDGKTALHYAVEAGRLDVVKLLIENGAKIDIKDKKGYNPLRIAKKLDNMEIEQYLLDIKK
jgi:ankyrin repeat protein